MVNRFIDNIINSSKYKDLDEELVKEIVDDVCLSNVKRNELEKKIRNLLHQTWGAFYPTPPNFGKLEKALTVGMANNIDEKTLLLSILQAHSSTKERLRFLSDFYNQIFRTTGIPLTILDLGCGLNPLTLPWMALSKGAKYTAVDVDKAQMSFILRVSKILNWNINLRCVVESALSYKAGPVDMVFLFKVIPVFEKLDKDFALIDFLRRFTCKNFVITFPTGTLSGGKVGMKNFYNAKMRDFLRETQLEYSTINFPNELVYIIRKRY